MRKWTEEYWKGEKAKYYLKAQDGIDMSFRDYRSQSNRELSHKLYSITVREFWHDRTVKIQQNGTVRIFTSASKKALFFRAPKSVARHFHETGSSPTIRFTSDEVRLLEKNTVKYCKKVASFYKSTSSNTQ